MTEQTLFEMELLQVWYKEMTKPLHRYQEPILENEALKMLKRACDAFNQDIHVFTTTVMILEEYIERKFKREEPLRDEGLLLLTSIFISSKFTGGSTKVSVENIIEFLRDLTDEDYDLKMITATEIEILTTLNGCVPLTTIVDDINTVVELFVRDAQLKANVGPLCREIHQLMLLCRNKWFNELRNFYCEDEDSFSFFQVLMVNRLYIPVVILIVSLHMMNYRNEYDIDSVLRDIARVVRIHSDHLNVLCSIISNLIFPKS